MSSLSWFATSLSSLQIRLNRFHLEFKVLVDCYGHCYYWPKNNRRYSGLYSQRPSIQALYQTISTLPLGCLARAYAANLTCRPMAAWFGFAAHLSFSYR